MAVGKPRADLPQLFLAVELLRLFGTAFANVPARNAAGDGVLSRVNGAVCGHFSELGILVLGRSSLVVLSRY